jgi:hypothetical protein
MLSPLTSLKEGLLTLNVDYPHTNIPISIFETSKPSYNINPNFLCPLNNSSVFHRHINTFADPSGSIRRSNQPLVHRRSERQHGRPSNSNTACESFGNANWYNHNDTLARLVSISASRDARWDGGWPTSLSLWISLWFKFLVGLSKASSNTDGLGEKNHKSVQ